MDTIKLKELYTNILEENAKSNGFMLAENVTFAASHTSPDRLEFDGKKYPYDDNTNAFAFIGEGSDLIGYCKYASGAHPDIFAAFTVASAVRGIIPFDGMIRLYSYKYNSKTPVKKVFKDMDISVFGLVDDKHLEYFVKKQKFGIMSQMRKATRSGRLWKSVSSETLNSSVNVISFWCDQDKVLEEDLKQLSINFKISKIYWTGIDSTTFNFHDGSEVSGGDIKKLSSKISPSLSHEEIVDILMRAHSALSLTPTEKRVVREFRGEPDAMKILGGYDIPAKYNSYVRTSESFDNIHS